MKHHRLLLTFGPLLCGLGVLAVFWLETASMQGPINDSVFSIVSVGYLPMVLIGVSATLVGSIMWAWRARTKRLVLAGFILGPLAFVAIKFTPINIHGWTFSLVFPYLTAAGVSVLFLVFAVVKAVMQAGEPRSAK